jgi:hypothetical protein
MATNHSARITFRLADNSKQCQILDHNHHSMAVRRPPVSEDLTRIARVIVNRDPA